MAPRVIDTAELDVPGIISALDLPTDGPVLVVVGGAKQIDEASQELRGALRGLFEDGVAPAISGQSVTVITGGTRSGIMKIAGETLQDAAVALVGVVPKKMIDEPDAVEIEPNHTAILATPGDDWGSETETLFAVADGLTAGQHPGALLLTHGGGIARRETKRFLRGGWPVMVVQGSRGSADDLLRTVEASRHTGSHLRRRRERATEAQALWGDVREADIEPVMANEQEDCRRRLEWRLASDLILKIAWARYASFSAGAVMSKARARRLQRAIGATAVLVMALILVLIQAAVKDQIDSGFSEFEEFDGDDTWLQVFGALLVALPAGLAIATSLNTSIGSSQTWIALRAVAEAIKREIYRYQAGMANKDAGAFEKLKKALATADTEALERGVPLAAVRDPVVRARPAEMHGTSVGPLTANVYFKHRIEDQLRYLQRESKKLRRQDVAFLIGSTASSVIALALIDSRILVAAVFAVLFSSVLVVSRQRLQARDKALGFGRAVAEVERARVDYLGPEEGSKASSQRLVDLVTSVEDALELENLAWDASVSKAAEEKAEFRHPHVDGA